MPTDKDIENLYDQLKSKYDLVLSSSILLKKKSKIDFPILCGKSDLGKFELFFDDVSFAFYAMHDNGEVFIHRHFQTISEAAETIEDFMNGTIITVHFGR